MALQSSFFQIEADDDGQQSEVASLDTQPEIQHNTDLFYVVCPWPEVLGIFSVCFWLHWCFVWAKPPSNLAFILFHIRISQNILLFLFDNFIRKKNDWQICRTGKVDLKSQHNQKNNWMMIDHVSFYRWFVEGWCR